MSAKKKTPKKKTSVIDKIKDIDLSDFKPSIKALQDGVQEQLKKRKDVKNEAIIEKAEIQRLEDEYESDIGKEFAELERQINPIFGLIFTPLNIYLKSKDITPFTLEEQKKIQHFTFAIIKKTLERQIVQYSEQISKGASVFSRIWEFLDIALNMIAPRIAEYYEQKKKVV